MCSVAPEEFKRFRSVCLFLIAVVTQSCLWVTTWYFIFVSYIRVWIFFIIITVCGLDRLGLNVESNEIQH